MGSYEVDALFPIEGNGVPAFIDAYAVRDLAKKKPSNPRTAQGSCVALNEHSLSVKVLFIEIIDHTRLH
jgi:hypothetical protein